MAPLAARTKVAAAAIAPEIATILLQRASVKHLTA
jgi:hypothetical protein